MCMERYVHNPSDVITLMFKFKKFNLALLDRNIINKQVCQVLKMPGTLSGVFYKLASNKKL